MTVTTVSFQQCLKEQFYRHIYGQLTILEICQLVRKKQPQFSNVLGIGVLYFDTLLVLTTDQNVGSGTSFYFFQTL